MKKAIVLYLHVHQPYRIKHYTIFDAGNNHNYFDDDYHSRTSNERIMHKVAEKSYIPTNRRLVNMLHAHPEFKLSLSITGTALEQMEQYSPLALKSFQELVSTGRVEILAETYYHSLAFFYNRSEFEQQVKKHADTILRLFGQVPQVFRNTELAYDNHLAYWADQAGYKGILAEGWDPVLGWRSPNYMYQPTYTENIRLLTKNYKLSDDIAFRFGDKNWSEWPLTAETYTRWLRDTDENAQIFNLFMDYETFGEHQWHDTGIFDFLGALPREWMKQEDCTFMTVSEAIDTFQPVDRVDVPNTITWADTERDLTAWLGNDLQTRSIQSLYALQQKVVMSGDPFLLEDWRRMQASDHFYYMCTKWFADGDVHAYFSPYESPYVAYMNFMNAWHDLCYRLKEKGLL
jgi:alpha-amylase